MAVLPNRDAALYFATVGGVISYSIKDLYKITGKSTANREKVLAKPSEPVDYGVYEFPGGTKTEFCRSTINLKGRGKR